MDARTRRMCDWVRMLYLPYCKSVSFDRYNWAASFAIYFRGLLVFGLGKLLIYAGNVGFLPVAVYWAVLLPLIGLFWLPLIVLAVRRMQDVGIKTPYLGWPLLALVAVFTILDAGFPQGMISSYSIYLAGFMLFAVDVMVFKSGTPVHGVGVFTAKGWPEPEGFRPFWDWD